MKISESCGFGFGLSRYVRRTGALFFTTLTESSSESMQCAVLKMEVICARISALFASMRVHFSRCSSYWVALFCGVLHFVPASMQTVRKMDINLIILICCVF